MNKPQADILVVDDQPVNIRLLATMLTQMGYKVRKATSGEMALTAIRAALPDLVLLDITMPQMDGYEVCRTIKSNPQTCAIPVIFVSALDESMDKAKAFEVGAIDYIAKPFQWAEVQTRIKTQLALRQLQQQSLENQVATPAFLPQPVPETMFLNLATRSDPAAAELPGFADWFCANPTTLHLALAQMDHATVGNALLLATVRGLFRGLGAAPTLSSRIESAQQLLASDMPPFGSMLRWVQAEWNSNDRTLHYGLVGYRLLHLHLGDGPTLQASEPNRVQSIVSLTLAPQDVVVIFSSALQPTAFQSPSDLAELAQTLQGASNATEMIERLWPHINPMAIGGNGSLLVLTHRP